MLIEGHTATNARHVQSATDIIGSNSNPVVAYRLQTVARSQTVQPVVQRARALPCLSFPSACLLSNSDSHSRLRYSAALVFAVPAIPATAVRVTNAAVTQVRLSVC